MIPTLSAIKVTPRAMNVLINVMKLTHSPENQLVNPAAILVHAKPSAVFNVMSVPAQKTARQAIKPTPAKAEQVIQPLLRINKQLAHRPAISVHTNVTLLRTGFQERRQLMCLPLLPLPHRRLVTDISAVNLLISKAHLPRLAVLAVLKVGIGA